MKGLKFTHKLVLITVLVSVLVWLVFGGMLFYTAKNTLEEHLAHNQVSKARDLMETVDRILFTAHQGIQVLAQSGLVIDFLANDQLAAQGPKREQASEHLENLSLLTGPWQVVSLLDTQGNLLVSNMPEKSGHFIKNHPEHAAAFQAALDNRVYSSDLHLVGEDNSPSLVFAAPVHRQGLDEAEVIGVVVGKYAWPVITQLLDGVERHVNVQLLRSDGTIIGTAASHRDQLGSKSAGWEALQAAGLGTGSLVLHQSATQSDSLVAAVRQRGHLGHIGNEWVLVLKTPLEMLLAPVYTLAWQLTGTALAGMLVLCAALFISGTYLTRPIGAVSNAVRSFSQGDMSARVDVNAKARDEIGELAQAFNNMADDIGFYLEQVRANSEEVRAFTYAVSHDLRAPLVNLQGFSTEIDYSLGELKTLLGPTLESLPEARRSQAQLILEQEVPEALQFIGSSVARMNGQIQAILKLSRLGHKELIWEQVDSAKVVEQVLSSLRHQLDEKQIDVETGRLPIVEADAFALEQIFGNLLDNAVKYTVAVPGHISIWSTENVHDITFHIRDSGPGIEAKNISRVFELFRRVDHTNTPGEGMGLAYVKALVRRLGGRIWCESTLGEGSTFSFSLARQLSIQARILS